MIKAGSGHATNVYIVSTKYNIPMIWSNYSPNFKFRNSAGNNSGRSSFRKLLSAMSFSSFGDWLGLLATTALAQQLAGGDYATANFAIADISGDEKTIETWLGSNPKGAFKDVEVNYLDASSFEGETGIISVTIATPNGDVLLD